MAIFSKTQFPKYQSPIRITRPYIKPNYLADTINSAIQGYGSIQGMNMQQQLFNAKLKAAQDAKLAQQTLAKQIGSMGATTGPDTFVSEGGMGMDDVDMTRVPGVTTPNPTMAAISQLMQSGATLPQASSLAQALYPRPDPNAQYTALRRQQMQEDRVNKYARGADTDKRRVEGVETKFQEALSGVVNDSWGDLLNGTEAEISTRFPFAGGTRTTEGWFDAGGQARHDASGYLTPPTGGPVEFREWVSGEGKQIAEIMLRSDKYTMSDVRTLFARMRQNAFSQGEAFRKDLAMASVPSDVMRIMRQNQGKRSVSQRAANLGLN